MKLTKQPDTTDTVIDDSFPIPEWLKEAFEKRANEKQKEPVASSLSGPAAAWQPVQAFDPNQPRDETGKWTEGGGSTGVVRESKFATYDQLRTVAEGSPAAQYGPARIGMSTAKAIAHLPANASVHDLAVALHKNARAEEPHVTPVMRDVVESASGRLEGTEYAVKSVKSMEQGDKPGEPGKLERKAAEKGITPREYAERIGDTLRYTAVFEHDQYTKSVLETVAKLEDKGYRIEPTSKNAKIESKWDKPDFKGADCMVITPNGLRTELQFHTPESLEVKKVAHEWYTIARSSPDPVLVKTLYQKMADAWRSVRVPVGALSLV